MTAWMERAQIPLYLAALAVGAALGWLAPGAAPVMEAAVAPTLMLLLYATFLAVPFRRIGAAFRDVRFMAAVTVLNFGVVPVVALGLSRFVAVDDALMVGVLMVLLTPCIDYVIVFARLGGADWARLLAATPVLMLLQILLLPVYLLLFTGGDVAGQIDWRPFAEAFVLFIVVPVGLSVGTHLARRFAPARGLISAMDALMVPLLMATLLVVVASQFGGVIAEAHLLVRAVAVYVAFAAIMPVLGGAVGKLFRRDAATRRALAFSGTTRNSLVVLPLALALPEPLALAAIAVVTQTLVELVAMVVFVRAIPALIRDPATSP